MLQNLNQAILTQKRPKRHSLDIDALKFITLYAAINTLVSAASSRVIDCKIPTLETWRFPLPIACALSENVY